MIHCTGVDAALSVIPFQDELEKIVGHGLGTADLLGQMAAEDYVDKLPILFKEFEEAGRHGKLSFEFKSAQELINSTPGFWAGYVVPKINRDFESLYRYLESESGRNPYLDRIQLNLDRLARSKAA